MKDSLNKHQILKVRSQGKKFDCKYFTGYFKHSEESGIAIVASGKLGSSIVRNRIKRRLRQALRVRLRERERKQQIKALLYAKNAVIKAKNDDLVFSIKTALGMI